MTTHKPRLCAEREAARALDLSARVNEVDLLLVQIDQVISRAARLLKPGACSPEAQEAIRLALRGIPQEPN